MLLSHSVHLIFCTQLNYPKRCPSINGFDNKELILCNSVIFHFSLYVTKIYHCPYQNNLNFVFALG